MALNVKLTKTPFKYLKNLDATTKQRVIDKLNEIATTPSDSRLSKPLEGTVKRCTRVGKYRVLFTIEGDNLIVSDIDSRGQVYRNI